MDIRQIDNITTNAYGLLLLADPSREAVDDYIGRGTCYGGFLDNKLIGIYVLLPTRPFTVELVNLAVSEEYQGRGYGKELISHAIDMAKKSKFKTIELGTGNAGIYHLALYQKSGFTITHIDIDFFRRHYPEPIFENGIECRHMVRMSMDI